MSISSLSFSAALPVYTSIGSNGTIFGGSSVAVKGDVAISNSGSASSGQANLLTSTLSSNGLSYTPSSSFVSGNKVTVFYNLDGNTHPNAATDETAKQTLQAGDQGVALNSGIYGSGITITPEGSETNGNITTTAYQISLNGPLDGVYHSINQQTGYSVSDATNGGSVSIADIGSIGNGLQVTYQLADAPNPGTPLSISSSSGNSHLPTALKSVTTIGDLLANTSGLSLNGTLAGAFQANKVAAATGSAPSNTTLAAALNPTPTLSPSTAIQVTDFINTSSDAFPTSAPAAAQPSPNLDNSGAQTNSNDNSSSQNNSSSGVYNAFANVGASTIRGGNLNVVT